MCKLRGQCHLQAYRQWIKSWGRLYKILNKTSMNQLQPKVNRPTFKAGGTPSYLELSDRPSTSPKDTVDSSDRLAADAGDGSIFRESPIQSSTSSTVKAVRQSSTTSQPLPVSNVSLIAQDPDGQVATDTVADVESMATQPPTGATSKKPTERPTVSRENSGKALESYATVIQESSLFLETTVALQQVQSLTMSEETHTSGMSRIAQLPPPSTVSSERYSVIGNVAEDEPLVPQPTGGRRLFLLRNAERIDHRFPGWLDLSVGRNGVYMPYDVNLPTSLPTRSGGYDSFRTDCCITEVGKVSAMMIGRSMLANNLRPDAIIVSPALRCIQTGQSILKMIPSALTMFIEPGLFEYLGWYGKSVPVWMTPAELQANKYHVRYHTPVMNRRQVRRSVGEGISQFYKRCEYVTERLLEDFADSHNILIIAHSLTMDAICGMLSGRNRKDPSLYDLDHMGLYYPYCAFVAFEEWSDGTWHVIYDAIPPLSCCGYSNRINLRFFNRDDPATESTSDSYPV
ncbi:unnamed protein product [Soboliphyme baturini]|uniref:Phosphoglycerate mutase family protein n=1 Tax=Soboliphyme baturini TaxID=241478 RepID=A0A183ILB0_9BILA|nr:unnamed protein product [Soboliphyme baturini]